MMIDSSQKAYEYFRDCMSFDAEEVWIVSFNSQLEIIDTKLLFRGTVDKCTVHPRDILRFICLCNAASFILAHNHPSGNYLPSKEDLSFTRLLVKLSMMVQIPISDHLIVCEKNYSSLADLGYISRFKKYRAKVMEI